MKPAEYQQQSDRLASYKDIQQEIDRVNTILERVDKYKDQNGGLGGKGIIVGFHFGNGMQDTSIRFDLQHRISKEVIDMLHDEILRLEKERDDI